MGRRVALMSDIIKVSKVLEWRELSIKILNNPAHFILRQSGFWEPEQWIHVDTHLPSNTNTFLDSEVTSDLGRRGFAMVNHSCIAPRVSRYRNTNYRFSRSSNMGEDVIVCKSRGIVLSLWRRRITRKCQQCKTWFGPGLLSRDVVSVRCDSCDRCDHSGFGPATLCNGRKLWRCQPGMFHSPFTRF